VDQFIADLLFAISQEILDIPDVPGEPKIKPSSMPDHIGRKSLACVGTLFVNVSVTTFCLHATRARLRTQLQIKELEHVLIKKARQLFRDMP
jgi:hypothetical protein